MDNNQILIFALIAIIFTVAVISFFFSKEAIIKRKLKKGELKRISDFKDGDIAKIEGKIEIVGKPIKAPLSQRECAHYYIKVEQRVSTGKSTRWKTIIEEEKSSQFVIRDVNGIALINDKKLESYIVQDREYESGFGNDATKSLEKYLSSHGIESENIFGFNKTIRYKEGILEQGENVAVFGRGVWRKSSDFNLSIQNSKILVFENYDDSKIYLSDDPETIT